MDSKTITINNKLLFEFNKTYFENNDNLLSSKFPNLQFDVNEPNINTLDKLIISSNIVLNKNYHLEQLHFQFELHMMFHYRV